MTYPFPAEELLRVEQGADYGWPECYFDDTQNQLVLAPEYGGDGARKSVSARTRSRRSRPWVVFRGGNTAAGVEPAAAPSPGSSAPPAAAYVWALGHGGGDGQSSP